MLEVVILCGGRGTRLWPLSRRMYPKQFMEIIPGRTLFSDALERVRGLDDARVTVVCNHEHRFMVAEQLQRAGCEARIVLEPEGRNTAPAMAAAALQCGRDSVMLVLPADHALKGGDVFRHAVEKGVAAAQDGNLVCFGIKPDRPETGYGYIKADFSNGDAVSDIVEFVEKPESKTAERYFSSGEHYWNSGMFMFRAGTYLDALGVHSPEILKACAQAVKASQRDLDFIRLDEDAFGESPSVSIDYAVMEKADNRKVVPLELPWSDLGGWEAVYAVSGHDDSGNAVTGDVVCRDTKNSYVHSSTKLVATLGIEDAVVVEANDVVLVASRNHLDGIRDMVAALEQAGREEVEQYPTVYRPWGSFQSLAMGPGFQVKRITVKPGGILSKQYHHHRAEHWVVVCGTALVTNGEDEFLLHEDQSTYIPLGHVHRLENPGTTPLEIIEVQSGSYLGEDDIVRLEDLYRRG